MTTSSSGAGVSGPRAVVAGHADFAAALVAAVHRITGLGGAFCAVSNEGLGAPEVELAIRAALTEHGATVVFTDLPAGSCTMAARKLMRTDPAISVVTGASVGLLLDFAMGADVTAESLQRAVSRGREAMMVFPAAGAAGGH